MLSVNAQIKMLVACLTLLATFSVHSVSMAGEEPEDHYVLHFTPLELDTDETSFTHTLAGRESITADGRFLLLKVKRTIDIHELYLYDVESRTKTPLVIVTPDQESSASGVYGASLSLDGKFVAFQSDLSNLVENDANGNGVDAFIHEIETGENTLISVNSLDEQVQNPCFGSGVSIPKRMTSISEDGRYAAFDYDIELSVDIDSSPYDSCRQIFVYDRITEEIDLVSRGLEGQIPNASSSVPKISESGRRIAYISSATNIVENDTAGVEILVYDNADNSTKRVSGITDTRFSGVHEDGGIDSYEDGRYVVFTDNTLFFIYIHDLETGQTTTLPDNDDIGHPELQAARPSISADGRYLAYCGGGAYVYDRVTGVSSPKSAQSMIVNGEAVIDQENYLLDCHNPMAISKDGSTMAFYLSGLIFNPVEPNYIPFADVVINSVADDSEPSEPAQCPALSSSRAASADEMRGRVINIEGNGEAGIQVIARDSKGEELICFTDSNGDFVFFDLAAGETYTVFPEYRYIDKLFWPSEVVDVQPNENIETPFVYVGGYNENADSDGLLNRCEVGIPDELAKCDGLSFVDMGASPIYRDLFIEVDWMQKGSSCCLLEAKDFEYAALIFKESPVKNPDPYNKSIVYGINLHIDCGHTCRGRTWQSDEIGGTEIPHEPYLRSSMDELTNKYLTPKRRKYFRHALIVDDAPELGLALNGQTFYHAEGKLNNLQSTWSPHSVKVFVHELGHTLGLTHGGPYRLLREEETYKPNHLSVMNLYYVYTGLCYSLATPCTHPIIDYSRFDIGEIATLHEDNLDEDVGIIGTNPETSKYSMTYSCINSEDTNTWEISTTTGAPIDWDCDKSPQPDEESSNAWLNLKEGFQELQSYNEWKKLIYDFYELTASTVSSFDPVDETGMLEALEKSSHLIGFAAVVYVENESFGQVISGSVHTITVTIRNGGTEPTNILTSASSERGWIDFSAVPERIFMVSNETRQYDLIVRIPNELDESLIEYGSLRVWPEESSSMGDGIAIKVVMEGAIDPDAPDQLSDRQIFLPMIQK